MSGKSWRMALAEIRMLHAMSEMVAIKYEGVDLGADLTPEERARGAAMLADIDYLLSKLDGDGAKD
jgi:hypothetical protein